MNLRSLIKRVMDAMGMTKAPPPARTTPSIASAEPPRGVVAGNAMSNVPASGPSDVAQATVAPPLSADGPPRKGFHRPKGG